MVYALSGLSVEKIAAAVAPAVIQIKPLHGFLH
jgi:hypothetical protein